MYIVKLTYFVCVLLFCALFWSTGVVAGEGAIIVKLIEAQSEQNAGILFDKLTFSAGFPPVKRLIDKIENTPYELQVLNSTGKVLYSEKFNFTRHLEVPLPKPGSEQKGENLRVPLPDPEAVLVIPYFPEGVVIRVKGPGEITLTTRTPARPAYYQPDSSLPSPIPVQEGNLYILLIASGYSDMRDFQVKAQEIKNNLLSKEPFFSRKSNIIISAYENMSDLGCHSGCFNIDRLMCCNTEKVMASAVTSGQLYDEIIIIHNTATYSGGGSRDLGAYQTNSASSYCQVYSGDFTAAMTLHEFGHSFGNLCDEYSYGSEGYSYYDCANCRASCSDWSNISTVCQLGCDARSNYFRPEDSIMLSLGISDFNQPSIYNSLIPRLQYFIPTGNPQTGSTPVPIFQYILEE